MSFVYNENWAWGRPPVAIYGNNSVVVLIQLLSPFLCFYNTCSASTAKTQEKELTYSHFHASLEYSITYATVWLHRYIWEQECTQCLCCDSVGKDHRWTLMVGRGCSADNWKIASFCLQTKLIKQISEEQFSVQKFWFIWQIFHWSILSSVRSSIKKATIVHLSSANPFNLTELKYFNKVAQNFPIKISTNYTKEFFGILNIFFK